LYPCVKRRKYVLRRVHAHSHDFTSSEEKLPVSSDVFRQVGTTEDGGAGSGKAKSHLKGWARPSKESGSFPHCLATKRQGDPEKGKGRQDRGGKVKKIERGFQT